MKALMIAVLLVIGWLATDFMPPDIPDKPDGKDSIKVVTCINGNVTDTSFFLDGTINEDSIDALLMSYGIDIHSEKSEKGMKKMIIKMNAGSMDGDMKVFCHGGDTSAAGMMKCITLEMDSAGKECPAIIYEVSCDGKGGDKHRKISLKSVNGGKEVTGGSGDKEIEIEVGRDGEVKKIIVNGEDAGPENMDAGVNVIQCQDGQKKIIIMAKIKIDDLDENDIQTLKKADVFQSAGKEILDVEQLDFYPNPGNGKFHLSFDLPAEGKTTIKIYDADGKEVYHEALAGFKGKYSNNIDISGGARGLYFLIIEQGNRTISKKFILE